MSAKFLENFYKLTIYLMSLSRFNYDSHDFPICMALDPAYARRRERAVVVGFADGRLVLTKENGMGFIFGRRTDQILYQGAASHSRSSSSNAAPNWMISSDKQDNTDGTKVDEIVDQSHHQIANSTSRSFEQQGIEAVAWRGTVIAWADDTGIKLLDVESGKRIAHVDRPSGARAALFPSVGVLRCHLTWETESSLLIGWGDCIMNMQIVKEDDLGNSAHSVSAQKKAVNVECTMAWELDCCVTCGIVPLDSDHVAVLGIATPSDDAEAFMPADNTTLQNRNLMSAKVDKPDPGMLELSIISRKAGTVISSDSLPLYTAFEKIPASEYMLVSSFALPRLDSKEEERVREEAAQDGGYLPSQYPNLDPHQLWSIKSVLNDEIIGGMPGRKDDGGNDLLHIQFDLNRPSIIPPQAPLMIVMSPRDVVLAQAHDVDDKVAHARARGDYEFALKLGINGRAMLRRHNLNILTNDLLTSLLREGSLESLQKAARLCPELLGGSSSKWERWIYTFAKIPGGLYALREFCPVRDPKLPPQLYEMVLEKMFIEIEGIPFDDPMAYQVKDAYLAALLAWGPTATLKERLKLLRWRNAGRRFLSLEETEIDMYRRFHQSAASSVGDEENRQRRTIAFAMEQLEPHELDSLYVIENVATRLASRLDVGESGSDVESWSSKTIGKLAALEAVAELSLCKCEYAEALRLYLINGFYCRPKLDDEAIKVVNTSSCDMIKNADEEDIDFEPDPYYHVVAMIEEHGLHGICLEEELYKVSSGKKKTSPALSAAAALSEATSSEGFTPIIALIQLVGLEMAGKFLVENCTHPTTSDFMAGATGAPLPLDRVAEQLKVRPKLLHWYLHQVFLNFPDNYTSFPHTTVPPIGIAALHKKHLEFYVKYGYGSNDESESIIIPFLKAAMVHGGATPADARRLLEARRREVNPSKSSKTPKTKLTAKLLFSVELAYAIEKSGRGLDDAIVVLKLYLDEVKSLSRAVTYVESTKDVDSETHDILRGILVEYCINNDVFGDLLEVSALCGADVAMLVSNIPKSMFIDGLRPKLVKAVENYRLQLDMYEATSRLFEEDKICNLRDFAHRSRKGRLVNKERPGDTIILPIQKQSLSAKSIVREKMEGKYHKKRSMSLFYRHERSRQSQALPIR